ncbi:hypothetical protein [Luteitalea sp.]|uniref:fibronectin type III domain-containing protein n=1 Tax=Luteitalea sp. TaxID=2004800 RepID=UPI0025C112B6|nr:hypothetical protein [Luteitalea sp.]
MGALALAASLALVSAAAAQIPITAAWDRNTDGFTAGYRVSVGTNPGSAQAVLDVGSATSVVLPLPPGGIYYVSVRGYTDAGIEGPSSGEVVVDLANSPGAPTAVQASVNGATASISWAPPDAGGVALNYRISVGTAPGASNILSDYPLGAARSVSGAVPPGTYFARVHAGNAVGIGPPSPDVSFHVGGAAPPGAPSALAATVAGSSVTLSWAAPAGGADTYIIEAGSATGAADIAVINVGGALSLTATAPPGTYFVRVRAVRGSGVSVPSNEVIVRSR